MRKSALFLAGALIATTAPVLSEAAAPFECAEANVPGGDWRRISNQLDGSRNQTAEKILDQRSAATLEPKWTFDANFWTEGENNEVTGYPIVADGCLYVGSSTGQSETAVNTPGWIFSMNADTGKLVWRKRMDGVERGALHYPVDDGRGNPCGVPFGGGGVYSTLAVEDGVVYAFVSQIGAPRVVALDQQTGEVLWTTVVDCQVGSDAVSSPIVFKSISGKSYVWVGVSGTAAEGDEADRLGFQGNYVILEGGRTGGAIVDKVFTIDESKWADGYAGANIWATVAIDDDKNSPVYMHGFVGTGNPFNYDREDDYSNALIKMDLRDELPNGDPNPDFPKITGVYKGDIEEFFPELEEASACEELEEVDNTFAAGFECLQLDLDFGAIPNIWWTSGGKRLMGSGQKSGVYHAVDPVTMEPVWKTLLGHPSAVGGIVGSAAYDGRFLYGPHTVGGYLWSIDKNTGDIRWITPVGDGVHWGNPVTLANGVLYTPDLKGFQNAYDAQSGLPLLARPMGIGGVRDPLHTDYYPTLSWGGSTVARGTVYTSVGVGLTSAGLPSMPNGYVIAFKPISVSL